jgi:hypothetical protein
MVAAEKELVAFKHPKDDNETTIANLTSITKDLSPMAIANTTVVNAAAKLDARENNKDAIFAIAATNITTQSLHQYSKTIYEVLGYNVIVSFDSEWHPVTNRLHCICFTVTNGVQTKLHIKDFERESSVDNVEAFYQFLKCIVETFESRYTKDQHGALVLGYNILGENSDLDILNANLDNYRELKLKWENLLTCIEFLDLYQTLSHESIRESYKAADM